MAKNVERLNGEKPNIYFIIAWYFISPTFVFIIWVFSWVQYEPLMYAGKEFSPGAQAFGWIIAFVSISAIPIAAAHSVMKAPGITIIQVEFSLSA